MIDKFLDWYTGEPKKYRDCNKGLPGGRHPSWAREAKLNLLPEEEAWDAYELCTECGKEWHEGDL